MSCINNYCVDWNRVLETIATVLSITYGCGPSLQTMRDDYLRQNPRPDWIKNPPLNHIVGQSDCEPASGRSWIDEGLTQAGAFGDVIQKVCAPHATLRGNQFESNIHADINGFPPDEYDEFCIIDGHEGWKKYLLFRISDIKCR